jgi:hypothetical protein
MTRFLSIELSDEEYEGLERECRRQEIEDGVEYISVEEQAASAVRFLLLTLKDARREGL